MSVEAKHDHAGAAGLAITDFEAEAKAEVRLCRNDPRRRQLSRLGQLTAGPTWKATLRLAAVRSPRITRAILTTSAFAAVVLAKMGTARSFAKQIAGAKNSVAFFDAAIREAGGWTQFRREFAMRVPVLCYHHVGTKLPGSWELLTISPETFQQEIEWLAKKGYTGIHTTDWLQWVQTGKPLPEKPILLTFDDAYADLTSTAIPVLRAHGFKATFFVVSQHTGGASTWDLALGYPSRPLMTADEIRRCPEQGIEIGAHTRTHPDLRKLGDAELQAEFGGCREDLTSLLNSPVHALAYPFGFHNERVCHRAGEFYQLSFTCRPGLNAWRTEPHRLRRMFVHPNKINFMLQVKYGVDLHAIYRFGRDRLLRAFSRLSSRTTAVMAGGSVTRPRPEDNL